MKQKNEIKNKMQITSLVKMKPQQIRKNRTLNNTNTNQIIMKNRKKRTQSKSEKIDQKKIRKMGKQRNNSYLGAATEKREGIRRTPKLHREAGDWRVERN